MFTKTTIITCNEDDVTSLVAAIWPHKASHFDSIVANEEIGNQEFTVYGVSADQFGTYDEEEFESWLVSTTYKHYITSTVMNKLCQLGQLDAGDYLIDCTW